MRPNLPFTCMFPSLAISAFPLVFQSTSSSIMLTPESNHMWLSGVIRDLHGGHATKLPPFLPQTQESNGSRSRADWGNDRHSWRPQKAESPNRQPVPATRAPCKKLWVCQSLTTGNMLGIHGLSESIQKVLAPIGQEQPPVPAGQSAAALTRRYLRSTVAMSSFSSFFEKRPSRCTCTKHCCSAWHPALISACTREKLHMSS